MVSFCLPLVPRDLSVCSVFFLGGEKRKIFVDHRVRAAEEAPRDVFLFPSVPSGHVPRPGLRFFLL